MKTLWARPWAWVVVAAIVRLALLVSLPSTGAGLAIPTQARVLVTEQPPSLLEFLQSRVERRPLTEDEHCYDEMAKNLVADRGFVLDTKWLITTPGAPAMYAGCTYPLFVAGLYATGGGQLAVWLVQILLAALAARWVFLSAARVAGRGAGALAAAFYTFHPTLVWSASAMMTESLCAPLVAALVWSLTRRSASPWRLVALAGLLAVLCLARSTFGAFVWIVAALLVWEARHVPWGKRLLRPLAFGAIFAALCAPWTIRNYVHFDRFIPFSTKSGTAAWMHNHPGLRVELGPAAIFGPQPIDIFDQRIQGLADEAERDETLFSMFRDFVASDPGKFAGLVGVRFLTAILPMAVTSKSRLATLSAWYAKGTVLLLLAIAVFVVRRRLWRRILPWVLFLGYWLGMQSLAGSGLRYRLPAEPVWACLVGVLAAVILAAMWRRSSPLARRWLRRGVRERPR